MKASEFVAQIQALIAEYGDLDVRAVEYGRWVTGPPEVLVLDEFRVEEHAFVISGKGE